MVFVLMVSIMFLSYSAARADLASLVADIAEKQVTSRNVRVKELSKNLQEQYHALLKNVVHKMGEQQRQQKMASLTHHVVREATHKALMPWLERARYEALSTYGGESLEVKVVTSIVQLCQSKSMAVHDIPEGLQKEYHHRLACVISSLKKTIEHRAKRGDPTEPIASLQPNVHNVVQQYFNDFLDRAKCLKISHIAHEMRRSFDKVYTVTANTQMTLPKHKQHLATQLVRLQPKAKIPAGKQIVLKELSD